MDPNVIRLLLGETTGDMDLREMYLGIGDDCYSTTLLRPVKQVFSPVRLFGLFARFDRFEISMIASNR